MIETLRLVRAWTHPPIEEDEALDPIRMLGDGCGCER
jgi:hypothetical protein